MSGAPTRFALYAALATLLTGCLQPVNAPRLGAGSLPAELAQVGVSNVDGYLGYQLKSELDYLLTSGAPATNPRYLLDLKVAQKGGLSIIDLPTGRPQVVTLQVQASYELKDTRTGKLRGSGIAFASASYDRSSQRFATIRALRNAEERVAKSLAERLKVAVVTALNSDPASPVQPAPPLPSPVDPTFEPPAREPGNDI